MLSNAYFLAKVRFDTAENEPAKNLQNLEKIAKFGKKLPAEVRDMRPAARADLHRGAPRGDRRDRAVSGGVGIRQRRAVVCRISKF